MNRTTMIDRYLVVIARRRRWSYEWSVKGPFRRVTRGTTITAWGARRAAFCCIWGPNALFERAERIECEIAAKSSFLVGDDPEPLPTEVLS